MEHLAVLLKNHQLKATHQRLSILELIEANGHIGIDAIYTQLQSTFPSLALATLYRNINDMCERGIIVEVKVPHQKSKYELAKSPHVHFVCERCGHIEDASVDTRSFTRKIELQFDRAISSSAILFHVAHCPRCASA